MRLPQGETRGGIKAIVDQFPQSGYADFARFALARAYVTDRVTTVFPDEGRRTIGRDTKNAAKMLLAIDLEQFAFLPQMETALNAVSRHLPPDRKVELRALPRTLHPDAFELTVWANDFKRSKQVDAEIRTPFVREGVKKVHPLATYQHFEPVKAIEVGAFEFAILAGRTVKVFDLLTGDRLEKRGLISTSHFTFNDGMLAGLQDVPGVRGKGRITMISGSNKTVTHIGAERTYSSCLALSPSGSQLLVGLASADSKKIEIWDPNNGDKLAKIPGFARSLSLLIAATTELQPMALGILSL